MLVARIWIRNERRYRIFARARTAGGIFRQLYAQWRSEVDNANLLNHLEITSE